MSHARPRGRSHLLGATAGVLCATAALLLPGGPAAAQDPDEATVTAQGELLQVIADVPGTEGVVTAYVQVGDDLVEVPDTVPAPVAATGTPVELTISAPDGTTAEAAVDLLGADQAPADVRVVEVVSTATPGEEGASADQQTMAAAAAHSITVLPVYWAAPDATTRAQLSTLATATSDYWSAQSGGSLALGTDVRDWKQIADPGTCSTSALWSSALQAHGISGSTATSHVAVYFPKRADCGGWAGMGSIGGGSVWVNGAPLVDVLAHEVGHNFGLGHANTAACSSGGVDVALADLVQCRVQEYADTADVMGFAMSKPSGNLNTAFADRLGLAQVQRVTPGQTVTVDLSPLAATSALRSLAIPVAGGTVYLDFRPAVGRDTRTPAWAGVQAHLRTTDHRGTPTTYLLDMAPERAGTFTAPALAPGASWTVPGGSNVVEVVSTGTTARVRVLPVPGQLFTDVGVGHPFYEEIRWLSERGITTGMPDGSFGATTPITREAMAAFLYRYAGVTGYTPPASPRFSDVPVGHPFYTEVSWLAQQGITTGNGDGTFGAGQPISRQAMAAFLYRFAAPTGYVAPATARFTDIPVGHPFYREISWLADQRVTNGLADGSFGAANPTTRQEMAAFLYRLDRLLHPLP